MQAGPNFAMLGPRRSAALERPERIMMRNLLRLLALGSALAAMPASAALHPRYQRIAELQRVLGDAGVGGVFESPIERVEYVRRDLYRVSGGGCRMDVAIVDLPTPPDIVGGRRFTVKPGRKLCGK
jgi:hypothetical protein